MACAQVRFSDKEATAADQANYANWWQEQLSQFGTNVWYYVKGYALSGHDFLYGEDLPRPFAQPAEIIVGMNITNDASMLSKFGIMLDSDAIAWIDIQDFQDVFGIDAEPKSGDVLELVEVGTDRPGVRGAPKYEITQRDDDQFPAGINTLMGHYIWYIRLKRFEYSHEPGITTEPGTTMVDDTSAADTAVATISAYKQEEDHVYGDY